jgi:AcrR family transcriptional regulator
MPYRPTEKTQRRQAETREAIVDAALAQVAEGGYASAGVQVVASRAGVATGSVYRHFGSKAELFAEVFRRAAHRELAVVERTVSETGGSTQSRIAAGAEAFARRALAGRRLAWSQLAEPVDPAVEAERLVLRKGYRDAFARTLDEGVAKGELPPHDTATVAAALVGALGEALVGPLADPSPGDRDRLVATLVTLCTDAVPKMTTEEIVHGRRLAPVA